MMAEYGGDFPEAERRFLETRTLCEEAGLAWHCVVADYHLGIDAYGQGDARRAITRLDAAITAAGAMGDQLVPAWANLHLALIACDQRDFERVRSILRSLVDGPRAVFRYRGSVVLVLGVALADAIGQVETAVILAGALVTTRHSVPFAHPEAARLDRVLAAARETLGADAVAAAFERGRRLRQPHVWSLLRTLIDGRARHLESGGGEGGATLSPREREVLALLAQGMTNQQIAGALFISTRTAANHVASILTKLKVPSRTAAVAWAVRDGLA
jgi:DNA-binding CsgD family transcriptional regulator